jgi:hypothetical protein
MCLYTTQDKQLTAETDKTVFKVVVFRDSQVFTPYTDTPISYETLNGQKPFKANGKTQKRPDLFCFSIEGGNIHTYATAAQAFAIVPFLPKKWGQPAVYECIIPKGTKYYYGHAINKTPAYASKRIRFVKRLHSPYEPKPKQTELDLR